MSETASLPQYGPGKFEGQPRCHAAIYDACMTGADDSIGDGQWADIMRTNPGVPLTIGAEDTDGTPFTDAEREYMAGGAGWIISGDEQGFVTVERFETAEDLEAAWACEVAADAERANAEDSDAE